MAKIGIIGGSGLEDPRIIDNPRERAADTRFGAPSSTLVEGRIGGVEAVLLSRHDRDHRIAPTRIPNRANLQALRDAGCTHVLASTAAGSLREDIRRGDFVILDQFIDFTRRRELTVFEDFADGMHHVAMPDPFDGGLRERLAAVARRLGIPCQAAGTVVTIEGPRFSTRAESRMFRAWGADVVNMSTAPECAVANELGLRYAAVAMATDYDSWKTDEEPVTMEAVMDIFRANAERMKALLVETVKSFAP